MDGNSRGVLYPAAMPSFHRLPAPDRASAWVRWFWIPEWDIASDQVIRQEIIAFPACNLVVEPHLVGLAGPTTRRSFRDLHGRGWAVGALLWPAAVLPLTAEPEALRDRYQPLDLPELHASVVSAMTTGDSGDIRRAHSVDAFTDWLVENLPPPDDEALLANRMAELIDGDAEVLRVADAASRLGVSARTLQRVARRHVGLSPGVMIRRRRLQEAAERLRNAPDTTIATVAADLGYTDHAHLSSDFRTVLGFTPSDYRSPTDDATS